MIKVAESSRYLLGLKTPQGILRAVTAQFGMLPIGKVFSKGVYRSIGHLREEGILSYADDIVILAPTLEKCMTLLDKTLNCLRADGYVVSARKCIFFRA